jgi:hypothetical protein
MNQVLCKFKCKVWNVNERFHPAGMNIPLGICFSGNIFTNPIINSNLIIRWRVKPIEYKPNEKLSLSIPDPGRKWMQSR